MKNTRAPQAHSIALMQQKTHPLLANSRLNIRFMMGMLTLTAAAALIASVAHAETANTTPPSTATAVSAASTTATANPAPKYAAQDVDRVFKYLDTNRDGKISREEAAAFKNIASHFDGADVNKDNFLTHDEFDNAVNGRKPQ